MIFLPFQPVLDIHILFNYQQDQYCRPCLRQIRPHMDHIGSHMRHVLPHTRQVRLDMGLKVLEPSNTTAAVL
ncbi:hypothetical protein [Candidatus Electronema sp. JM]|uniref:hypothetical protein n=1 Tax=Candidatus Electronema sp. JM TaxID=3401571 RepID=UPI003AA923B1